MQCFVWLVLVCVVMVLPPGLGQDSCRVQDGKPGEKGIPGREGFSGQKGEKGEPSYFDGEGMVRGPKGDQGSKGEPGEIGQKGYTGDLGPQGPSGFPGSKGASSGGSGIPQNERAGFSVTLTVPDLPPIERPLKFDTVSVNINQDFSTAEGKFTCKIPGIYYFAFHAMSAQNICVRMMSDALSVALSFCDYNSRQIKQVVSGGTVLKLSAGQKVWLEPFKGYRDKVTPTRSKERFFVFNGFLVSAMA
ncbi:complement C1q subcomponent subunit A [Sardina pilchardus]|uniref:complement C1q subcomponent subunit A n=1 Tax=Sardina pilchardus TaxID=27697 RepID=UPI002E14E7AD